MEAVLAIFADIDDPRDHTAQYELPALLFMALAATLCRTHRPASANCHGLGAQLQ